MMDLFKGIKVEVISNGLILPFYADGDAPDDHNPRERKHYVEATIGALFTIKVTLTNEFQFGESEVARVGISFDGDIFRYSMIKKKAWLLSRNESLPFSHFTNFCPVSSTWKQRAFIFGGLDIIESTNTRIRSDQLKALGQIRLRIERMNLQILTRPVPFSLGGPLNRVAEVSEKTLKGSAISSTVSFTEGQSVARPQDINYSYVEIPGRLGERVYFQILYRSKRALQMLGCLPRTPSPEAELRPSINNSNEGTSHNSNIKVAPQDRDQEIRDLRARLALLEDGENAKSKFSRTAEGIKRERGENNQSQSSNKRPKNGPIETIDLTDD